MNLHLAQLPQYKHLSFWTNLSLNNWQHEVGFYESLVKVQDRLRMMVLVSTGDVARACACVRACARVCCAKETVNAGAGVGALLVKW